MLRGVNQSAEAVMLAVTLELMNGKLLLISSCKTISSSLNTISQLLKAQSMLDLMGSHLEALITAVSSKETA